MYTSKVCERKTTSLSSVKFMSGRCSCGFGYYPTATISFRITIGPLPKSLGRRGGGGGCGSAHIHTSTLTLSFLGLSPRPFFGIIISKHEPHVNEMFRTLETPRIRLHVYYPTTSTFKIYSFTQWLAFTDEENGQSAWKTLLRVILILKFFKGH